MNDQGNTARIHLGKRLAEVREAQGVDQKALAEALGMSASALCRIEKGQRGLDSLVLYRAAEVLGQPLTAFFPTIAGDTELMLARRGVADDEALGRMSDWSVKVLEDLDFVRREHTGR